MMMTGMVILAYLLCAWGVMRFFQAVREWDDQMSSMLESHVKSRPRLRQARSANSIVHTNLKDEVNDINTSDSMAG